MKEVEQVGRAAHETNGFFRPTDLPTKARIGGPGWGVAVMGGCGGVAVGGVVHRERGG